MKNLLFLIPLFFVSLCLVSCGDDDDKMDPDTDKTTAQMTNDYIATTSVKKVTMTRGYAETRYDLFGIKIYEDYNHLYSLSMGAGTIEFIHYQRVYGSWATLNGYYDDHGISDRGKVGSIEEITSKSKDNDYTEGGRYNNIEYKYSTVQPNHGYAAYFTTEESEVKYLRIFITDYTLDDSGALETITVQYQLY